jgi:SAM-dependent methyltransferase
MPNSNLFNLDLVSAEHNVDRINKAFYERYSYPWPPSFLQAYPPGFSRLFLSQDIGDWSHRRIPQKPRIWVAGCGTNQALLTALKFPEAEVLGTDISAVSLQTCKTNAESIGVKNLMLEEKNINDVKFKGLFDYIICTGVIHHNAYPEDSLRKITDALKQDGVLELMVYNYYHRLLTTACQKAVRKLYDSEPAIDMDLELQILRQIIRSKKEGSLMNDFLQSNISLKDVQIADNLLQPVEYSYTVETLNQLVENCDLQLLLPCLNQWDVSTNNVNWNMRFSEVNLSDRYNALPDIHRWQVCNLLKLNESPMLWFYLQRRDSAYRRKTERQIGEEFLNTRFVADRVSLNFYGSGEDGCYRLTNTPAYFPSPEILDDPMAKKILAAAKPNVNMKEIFSQLNIRATPDNISQARICLTTSAFPFLRAVNA